MFKREENPELFDILMNEFINKSNDLSLKNDYDVLTEKELSIVTYLKIDDENPIKSLNGIEHCTNLREFECNGVHKGMWLDKEYNGKSLEAQYKARIEEVKVNQIKNITPLYNCKKLEKVHIKNQRVITSLDLSNWKNLNTLDALGCENLQSLQGITSFIRQNNKNEKNYLYLSGCDRLKNIDNFLEFVEYLDTNNLDKNNFNINLSTLSYFNLCKNYSNHQLEKSLNHYYKKDNCNSTILWGENFYAQGYDIVLVSSPQMFVTKAYIDEVIKNEVLNKDCLNDYEKIFNIYSWISNNIEYDNKTLKKEQLIDYEQRKFSPTVANLRSSFMSLWTQKCVCVGFANLFNSFMVEMGYDATPVMVGTNEVTQDEPYVLANHCISKIKTKQGNYFFDQSTKNLDHFFMNSTELKKRGYTLSYTDYIYENSPSKQMDMVDAIFNDDLNKLMQKGKLKCTRYLHLKSVKNPSDFTSLTLNEKDKQFAKENVERMQKERLISDLNF